VEEAQVAVIGAGPHGLAATAHLARAGAEVHTFGEPLDFWKAMPKGMLLRSNWTATSIAEHDGPLSLTSYCESTGTDLHLPVPLDAFVDYGMWVQGRAAPDVDRRRISRIDQNGAGFSITLADGERMAARTVAVAAGIAPFTNRPEVAAHLPRELVSHTADHDDLSRFKDQEVLVVGAGQSALESAALMHEAGTSVEVVARADHINWLHGGKYHRMLGPKLTPLVYAPTDVGPMGLSRIVAVPDLFRRFPRAAQKPMAYRAIRPAGAAWLQPRLVDVPLHLGRRITAADGRGDKVTVRLDDGTSRTVDHVLFGTGYRVDVSKYPFLSPELVSRIKHVDGYPVLRRGMESSVPGLHFLGAPAAWSFGPIMRFVAGGWYGASSLTRRIVDGRAATGASTFAVPSPVADDL
jgi:thioredoxin reductase